MTEKDLILENSYVLIDNGIITKISSEPIIANKNTTVIDGKGELYLIPGMMDSHAHLPLKQGVDIPLEDYLFLHLANGVTSLRCCRYEKRAMHIRDSLRNNNKVSPRLYLSSPMIANFHSHEYVFDYTKADSIIPSFKNEGYDFIKFLGGLNPFTHRSMLDICHEANFPIVGHLPKSVGLDYAISSVQDDIEHFQGYVDLLEEQPDTLKMYINQTAEKGIYNCPTIFWYDSNYPFLDSDYLKTIDGLEFLDPELVESWFKDHKKYFDLNKENPDRQEYNKRKEVLSMFGDTDAKLLLSHGDGDFCVPGFGMLEEMKIWKEAGINSYKILEAATINAALFFEEEDEWGTIQEGMLADLVILSANPLEDIEHIKTIESIISKGEFLSKLKIESGLEKIKSKYQ